MRLRMGESTRAPTETTLPTEQQPIVPADCVSSDRLGGAVALTVGSVEADWHRL